MKYIIAKYGTIITFIVMVLFFMVFLPPFRSQMNLVNILGQTAILGLFSIALTCPLKVGDIDFSIGATASSCGIAAAMLLLKGIDIHWAIGISLAIGIVIGIFNGVLVGYLNFDSFICTIGTSLLIFGIAMGLTRGQNIFLGSEISDKFGLLGSSNVCGIPIRFLLMTLFAIPIWLFHAYTETGRGIEAIAGNATAARLYGINVNFIKMLSFVLSGLCASAAGIVITSSIMSARAADNLQYILGAMAACFIGASTMRIGQFHIGGTILGVFFTVVATNGFIILMVPSYVTKIVTGTILLIAILLSIVATKFIEK